MANPPPDVVAVRAAFELPLKTRWKPVDPAAVKGFLEHRMDALDTLARREHWVGIASINAGGQYVLGI